MSLHTVCVTRCPLNPSTVAGFVIPDTGPTFAPRAHTPGSREAPMETDLTVLSPAMLDGELKRAYEDHRRAMESGDMVEKQACHLTITALLEEYGHRTDAWLAEHAAT